MTIVKYIRALIGLSLFVAVLNQPVYGQGVSTDSQLRRQFESALKTKDQAAALSLFNWQGVSPAMKAFHSNMIAELLKQEVTNVARSPFPTNFPTTMEEAGVRYSLNVAPAGILNVWSVRSGTPVPLPYGKRGEFFYIAGSIEESITAPVSAKGSVTVRVQTEDGKPLARWLVVCASPDKIPYLQLGKLFGGVRQLPTDEQGKLAVPLDATNLFLVATDAESFGWLQNEELTNGATMVMRRWGRIEGTRTNRNHPVAGEHLKLAPDRDFYGDGGLGSVVSPVSNFGGGDTLTDAAGHFVFEHVPPLKLFIDRQERKRGYWGYFWSVDATQGGALRLDIVTHGRSVTGRVLRAPGLGTNIDLSACSGALMSVLKGRDGSRCSVGFPILADGSFCADHVEAGDYKLSGDVRRDDRLVALLDPVLVHVPEDHTDAEDAPFDIGNATLKAAVNFMQGDTAPDFSCATLDDKRLKLSDFRGKYVLLDFWATWCGPCVAETPNMKATYEAFGKDKRFIMISLSLDADPAAPKKFVRNREIAWAQGFLGDWSKDETTQLYGVYGIPAIFLVGPDGKVLATGLRGEKIKEAVAAALAH